MFEKLALLETNIGAESYVLSVGYDDHRDPETAHFSNFGEEATEIGQKIGAVMNSTQAYLIANQPESMDAVYRTLIRLEVTMSNNDLLFLYYAGHALRSTLEVPLSYPNPKSFTSESLTRKCLLEKIGTLPGLKVVILNTCFADTIPTPNQTLFIGSSQAYQATIGARFTSKLVRELVAAEQSPNPRSYFLHSMLTGMHNFPLMQNGVDTLCDPTTTKQLEEMYQSEKSRTTKPEENWQRAVVRVNMELNGQKLTVDPACLYEAN